MHFDRRLFWTCRMCKGSKGPEVRRSRTALQQLHAQHHPNRPQLQTSFTYHQIYPILQALTSHCCRALASIFGGKYPIALALRDVSCWGMRTRLSPRDDVDIDALLLCTMESILLAFCKSMEPRAPFCLDFERANLQSLSPSVAT